MQLKQLLVFGQKTKTQEGCTDCESRAFNHFCVLCERRFCAGHIDNPVIHTCGVSGLTKKQYIRISKQRITPLNEREIEAKDFGRKLAEKETERLNKLKNKDKP